MSRIGKLSERALAAACLVAYSGALIPLWRRGHGDESGLQEGGGDPVKQAIWWATYGITLLLIVPRWRAVLRAVLRDRALCCLLLLAPLSLAWSAAPDVTLRRAFALLMTTAFGAYLASEYEPMAQLRLAAWVFGVAALLSAAAATLMPSYGIMDGAHSGSWRGAYLHKNGLGHAMGVSTLVFCLAAAGRRGLATWLCRAALGLSAALLVLSRAMTPLVTLLAVLPALPLMRTLRRRYTLWVPVIILAALAGAAALAWVSANWHAVLSALGKDPTLSDRRELWPFVVSAVERRPWLGYGYGAFWGAWNDESVAIWLAAGWDAPHAHNGILELWLSLGALGVAAFTVMILRAVRGALALARAERTAERLWPAAYVLFTLTYAVTESALVAHNDIYWVMLVAVVLTVRTSRSRTPTFAGVRRREPGRYALAAGVRR